MFTVRKISKSTKIIKRSIIGSNNIEPVKRRLVDDDWWDQPSVVHSRPEKIPWPDNCEIDREFMPEGSYIELEGITQQYADHSKYYSGVY